jgi:hypothetical protein
VTRGEAVRGLLQGTGMSPSPSFRISVTLCIALSRAEAKAAPLLASNFARIDTNNDGSLNRYELNSPSWRPLPGEPD